MEKILTKELINKASFFGACRLPKVGTAIINLSQEDIIFAESLIDKQEIPLWAMTESGEGYGVGAGYGEAFRYGDGDGYENGDPRGSGTGSGDGTGYGYDFIDSSGDGTGKGYGDSKSHGAGDGSLRIDTNKPYHWWAIKE